MITPKTKEVKDEYWKIQDTLKLIEIAKDNGEQEETITHNRINHLSTNINLMREGQEHGLNLGKKEALKDELKFLELNPILGEIEIVQDRITEIKQRLEELGK